MIGGKVVRRRFFYGWVVVGICMLLMASNSTIINSFGVFFKPLASDFGWSRADTSLVQSISLICNGMFGIVMGWLADRFGRSKVLALCGILIGFGLLLTSRITALWQIYLTFGLMTGIGLSSTFAITGTTTARWFKERRGLALGIMTSGIGLGSLFGVPAIARLIETSGWSRAYFILGAAALVIMSAGAWFLRRDPPDARASAQGTEQLGELRKGNFESSVTLLTAVRTKTLWLLCGIFFLFSFCNQMAMVHLVNYATDMGIAPLVAATLFSGVGLSSIVGRVSMGGASDKIGSVNALAVACFAAAMGLVLLVFARDLWMFYLFTIVWGFAYGAELPQQPALISKFFGLRAVLVGSLHSGAGIGGALGAWAGGQIFDVTHSYQVAFLIGIAAIISTLVGTVLLRKMPSLHTSENRQSRAGGNVVD